MSRKPARNAVGTQAAGECFHSFFELEKKKQLVYPDYQNEDLFARVIIASTACTSSVFTSSYKNTIFNQRAYFLTAVFYEQIVNEAQPS